MSVEERSRAEKQNGLDVSWRVKQYLDFFCNNGFQSKIILKQELVT